MDRLLTSISLIREGGLVIEGRLVSSEETGNSPQSKAGAVNRKIRVEDLQQHSSLAKQPISSI